MTPAERTKRNVAMCEYKSQGHTNKEVAEKFGLHEDTVKVICRGIAPQNGKRKRSGWKVSNQLCVQIRKYYEDGNSAKKTADKFGISDSYVRKICKDIPTKQNDRHIKALKLIESGYTAQEIVHLCGYKSDSTVYELAKKHGKKLKKAHADKHEAMRKYKAEGHTMGEVAEKFGVTKTTAQIICKGIAPQKARPPKDGYHATNKGKLQNIDNVICVINERASGFEYAGNYTGSDGHVDLRCKKCGHIRSANWNTLRHNGINVCPNCERIEREKRDAKEKQKREQQRLDQERKKRGKEAIRMLKRAKRLHRCPVCGTITDNKEYCSAKCWAKAHEATKDANRRKKIQNALVDKNINLERLYDRDNGICCICGGKCDWNDHQYRGRCFIVGKNYPSIDHIVPLSKGGKHSWSNVQLAHLSCNSAKGAKVCG